jgi:endo-1,4-beta-xylanase
MNGDNIMRYYIVVLSFFIFSSFNLDSRDPETLKNKIPFPIGVSVNIKSMRSNSAYTSLVLAEFNSVTAENCMKFATIHPGKDVYNWKDADYLVKFASNAKLRIHGHTLVWHKSLPSWIKTFKGNKAEWEELLKSHIQTIVHRYKGTITGWDVVNEAINDDGTYRSSIWFDNLGEEYIAKSFIYAHEADPQAKLFYNDYGYEYSSVKRVAILKMIQQLKDKGIPIDGIGLQMHTNSYQSIKNLNVAINSSSNLNLLIHVSELDVAVNTSNNPNLLYTPQLRNKQGEVYVAIFKAYLSLPKIQQYGITFWNLTDSDSWISKTKNRPDWPLLFDKNYKKKSIYNKLLLLN